MIHESIDIFKSFTRELDPKKLQSKFLLSLLKIQDVERGSIWIKHQDRYRCVEAMGVQSEDIEGVTISARNPSIVGWVIENGKMTISDPRNDSRHYKDLEEHLSVKSSLILCFPLVLSDKTVYGAVQIIDTSPQKDRINLDDEYLSYIQNLVDIGSIALSNALVYNNKAEEARLLKHTLSEIQADDSLIGQDPSFLKAMELARGYALSDFPVLITGESGTGKDLIANKIHQYSNRNDRPFLVQNCSAIPENLLESELFGYKKGAFSGAEKDKMGLFEAANGGTVFLDEIGDMPFNLQARILRVIQNGEIKPVGDSKVKKVDIRVISATNKDIVKMTSMKEFREDLYYRLSVLPLHLPPLRERKADIPMLVNHFLKREALRMKTPPKEIRADAMRCLMGYVWHGNVRELENMVRYLMVAADKVSIGAADLPEFPREKISIDPGASSIGDAMHPLEMSGGVTIPDPGRLFNSLTWKELETTYAQHLLQKNNWNFTRSAADAGVNRSTFVSRLRRLGIKRKKAA
ncbi:MAG: GAF domain-containing protein [Desulfobacterales bacterium]|nr:GAF domain-containing protein [Desulfobacterales bacterium]